MSMAATEASSRRKRKGRKNPLAGFSATVEEQSALDQYLRDVSRHELINWGTRRRFRNWPERTCGS